VLSAAAIEAAQARELGVRDATAAREAAERDAASVRTAADHHATSVRETAANDAATIRASAEMEAAERARDVIAAAEAEARRIVEGARDEASRIRAERVPAPEAEPFPRPAVRPVVQPSTAANAPTAPLGTVSWRPDGVSEPADSAEAAPSQERPPGERELAFAGAGDGKAAGKPKRRFLFFKRS